MRDDAPGFALELNHNVTTAGQQLRLPDFTNEPVIHVFSDYSGQSEGAPPDIFPQSRYRTYTFLFTAGQDTIVEYRRQMESIRRKYHIPPEQEIAYSEIRNSDAIHAALPEIVSAVHRLRGFIFTLAVERSVPPLFGDETANLATARAAGLSFKRPGILERALRVSYSIAYWLAVMAKEQQVSVWVADRDEILEERHKESTHKILSNALEQMMFSGRKIGGKALFNIKEYHGFPAGDLLAIPDLVAGSVSRCLSDLQDPQFSEQRGVDVLLDILTPREGSALSGVIYTINPPDCRGRLTFVARRA